MNSFSLRCYPVLILGCTLVASCSSTQMVETADMGGNDSRAGGSTLPVFTSDEIRSHMAFLSSDELKGRDTGSLGYMIAARYVAANFERLGLEPGGEDDSYFQTVTLQKTVIEKGPVLRIDGREVPEQEFVFYPDVEKEEVDVGGPGIFVGYGIDAPTLGTNDYEGLDAKGKVVVSMIGGPESFASEEASYFTSRAAKASAAAARGALAILFVDTPAFEQRFSFERRRRFLAGRPTTTWVAPSGVAFSEYGGIPVGYLSNEAAARVFEGAPKSLEEVRAESTEGPVSRFDLKVNFETSQSTSRERISSPNVVGIIRGSDPALSSQYVVLSAHLDHVGVGRPVEGDSIYNGALDNAAGVSVLLEVARAFSEERQRPRRSLLFLALAAEEKGLLGSEFFAAYPTVPKAGIVADVNLDMPLILYDFTDVVAFGAEHSSLGKTVANAASEIGIALSPDPMPEENLFTRSDHYSFVKQGVPSVFLVTGFANGGEVAFRSFLDTHYHRPSDEITLPIDFRAGAKFALVNYLIAREIANADKAPTWNPGDFFGEKFGG